MADEPNPQPNPQIDTLMRVQSELTVTRAQHNDLTLKIRHRELVDRRRIEALVFARLRSPMRWARSCAKSTRRSEPPSPKISK
jgi:hypothetical protein